MMMYVEVMMMLMMMFITIFDVDDDVIRQTWTVTLLLDCSPRSASPTGERSVLGELSMARDLTLKCNDEELQNVTKASGPAPDGVGAKAVEGDDSGAGTTGLESPEEDRTDNELTCE